MTTESTHHADTSKNSAGIDMSTTTEKLAESLRNMLNAQDENEGYTPPSLYDAAQFALAGYTAEQAQAREVEGLTDAYELDDLDRDLLVKVREAIEYDDNGDPVRDVMDEDEMVDAMRLLLKLLATPQPAPAPPAREPGCDLGCSQEHARVVRLDKAQAAPEAQQPAGRASVDDWERELSAVMPADFKDWWQNSRREWPAVAAEVIKSLRLDRDAGWEVAALAQRREQQ